jgi:hypothetical protein
MGVPEVASVDPCVSEVAVRHFCVAKLPQPETCLRPLDIADEAHTDLAALANHHNEPARSDHT